MNIKITKPTNRKTIESKTQNIFGELSTVKIIAWCFPNNDINEKPVKMLVPALRCYVEEDKQQIDQHLLTIKDIRPYTTEVWNEKCRNRETRGKWLTNWEYEQYTIKIQEQTIASETLISLFV